ncbi:GH25 family lysozyme [Lichenihabitans sp. Uapishka_5]|uniref:GH25 family lysozyme n=1 Tax=Lichenihabitans sp. Uapishka_5 TaxID=3037302 RepID=UPI0029E80483|nr:GH25 family lysozyme [Lichenihabitans sp. Uapishka_5]MDX7951479.1 GH25 family lysozyme [Lichenihabitans sp. Uapishka_5]
MPAILYLAVAACTIASSGARADDTGYVGVCPNGAPAKEAYCGYFRHFNAAKGEALDSRIADNLGVQRADQTRSIALVIAVGKYPKMSKADLSAAVADGDNLESFLTGSQRFDEVIVLRDGEATSDAISYFLTDYLPNRADDFRGKARLLVAYSGHGRPDAPGEKAAFLLSDADDVHGAKGAYPMFLLSGYIQALASRYFHVLTLINACYGGSFFGLASTGGSPNKVGLSGSYAITAGPKEEEVPALIPSRGSVFFDLIVDGVTRGVADRSYWDFFASTDEQGNLIRKFGLTRTGSLEDYLTSAYDRLDKMRSGDKNFRPLVSSWLGPAQEGVARGGFFFLSDVETGSPTALVDAYGKGSDAAQDFGTTVPTSEPEQSEAFSVPAGPLSSLPGHPEVKVFKQPEVYPIRGYDLSSADGHVDWSTFSTENHPRFVYARALGWKGADPSLADRFTNLGKLGIDHGAYLKFDFCRSAEAQLASLRQVVPPDPDLLPVTIELVTPTTDQDESQSVHETPCYQGLGASAARAEILKLAGLVKATYGKVPLVSGNAYNLSVLTDARFDQFMVWLNAYSASSNRLKGRNPWTLWQYSGSLDVKGIGPHTTGEAFFGTEDQYASFKKGAGNVALEAVLR